MAKIDVSELLTDPDFVDRVTLIRRASSVDDNGKNVLVETPTPRVKMVVQDGVEPEHLVILPQGARLVDWKTVYYKGALTAESENGYSDIIVHGGVRFIVSRIAEDFMNWGKGWTKALVVREKIINAQ